MMEKKSDYVGIGCGEFFECFAGHGGRRAG